MRLRNEVRKQMVLYIVLILLGGNAAIVTTIDRLKHPHLTETQLVLRLPQTFLWRFEP